jgi:hypothetical protein
MPGIPYLASVTYLELLTSMTDPKKATAKSAEVEHRRDTSSKAHQQDTKAPNSNTPIRSLPARPTQVSSSPKQV